GISDAASYRREDLSNLLRYSFARESKIKRVLGLKRRAIQRQTGTKIELTASAGSTLHHMQ
ncbi:MAG: hypothetical protein ABR501_12230, partial [Pyrinomonadaceae bacterium]